MNVDRAAVLIGADTLFVPPPGWAQFVLHAFPDIPIWVETEGAPIDYPAPGCVCGIGYLVMQTPESLNVESLREGHPAVCKCWGRWLE